MKTMKTREAAPHIRRPGKLYRAEDYDDEGNLKAPVWLWAGVAWMLLPWWLAAAGIVSHNTPAMAETLYPTLPDMLISLLAALPAVLLCVVYPLRGRYPVAALMTYGTVYVGLVLELLRTGSVFLRMPWWISDSADLLLACLSVDFAVLVGLLLTPRLWTVFGWPEV
ncbi:TPA: DUF2919 family protein, partial [Salmonella enterica]|nr:DUF2919 family protein [Salmonella enterica subsp. enterica serovar Oranienburg]HAK8205317.1 DUF2919 family protein [Salmonella enterica]